MVKDELSEGGQTAPVRYQAEATKSSRLSRMSVSQGHGKRAADGNTQTPPIMKKVKHTCLAGRWMELVTNLLADDQPLS
eukprot:6483364-Amphidinium_carterae.2